VRITPLVRDLLLLHFEQRRHLSVVHCSIRAGEEKENHLEHRFK